MRKADKLRWQSEKIRGTCKHLGLLVGVVRCAHKQRMRKVARGKGLDLAPLLLNRRARYEYPRTAVESRRKRHRAEAIHRMQYVVVIAVQERPFEYRRDGNCRREANAVGLLQAPYELCRAEPAIAFADDGNGNVPKL